MTGRGRPAGPLVNRETLKRLLGISERTLTRLGAEGVARPVRRARGTTGAVYDLAAVVPAYVRRLAEFGASIGTARDARDRSQAELNRLRLGVERRELLPRARVIAEGQQFIGAAAAKLRSIAPRAAQEGIVPEARRNELEDMVEATIADLANVGKESR